MQKYAKEEKTVQRTVCMSSEQIHSKTSCILKYLRDLPATVATVAECVMNIQDGRSREPKYTFNCSHVKSRYWQLATGHTHTHTHLIFSAMGRAKHHHLQLLQWKKTEGSALHLQRNSGDYMTPTKKIQYYGQISQNDHWTIHLYCLTPCWFPQYRYFNDPPNKWTWFTLKKMNPVTGQKTPQRQTAGTWKDPSIESNGTWYVINDKWQVI